MTNKELKTKSIFIVWTNTDLTEGRGYQVPIAYCEKEATARRLAKKKGVMGTDASISEYAASSYNGEWLAPIRIEPSTKEDDEQQKKIDAYNATIKKARAAGLSEEDLKILKG